MKPGILLASASPRRREMLHSLGISFRVASSNVPEDWPANEGAVRAAVGIARRKARSMEAGRDVVVAMDTIVAVGRHKLGKPGDEREAVRMLRRLSGREHRVVTGVAIRHRDREAAAAAVTRVAFRKLTAGEIAWYVRSGEPFDKAGAYAIQGLGRLFVRSIRGCYFNVVGFPVSCFLWCLDELGFSVFDFMKESV